jgi:small membrane protein
MQIFGIELLGSQLILSVVILFILFKTWRSYRKKQISISFFVLWILLWLIGLFVIFYPGLLTKVANLLNIGRGVDFALYVSIILIFYLIYKINLKIGKMNRDLTKIVRKISISKN